MNAYHRQSAWLEMLQIEVLIFEFSSIDRFAASAVVIGEVTTLAHEVRNDTMECGSLVAKTLLTSTQSTEVLGSSWRNIRAEL